MTVRPIVVLSDSLIDLIAAGEVVERPASVLKELIENSLDASASRITVDIQGGGTRLVQVADNGEGLSEQNALLAIERHATSKLTRAEDLEEILTMGFRGEALPSIAAVGKFVMESWDGSSTSGTRVVIRNGRLSKVEPCARSRGTTASLERIFQNIPARRKFLKSRGTEMAWCLRAVEEAALARPDVHFEFHADRGAPIIFPSASNLKDRIAALWGAADARGLFPLESELDGIRVRGFISAPNRTYGRRSRHHVLVNRRPVRDPGLNRTISSALASVYPSGRFPALVLSFHFPAGELDVNVHPSKREVRVRNLPVVSTLLKMAIRGLQDVSSPVRRDYAPPPSTHGARASDGDGLSGTPCVSRQATAPLPMEDRGQVIGQFLGAYILVEAGDELRLIDQHAAHERIMFNRLLSLRSAGGGASQNLIIPALVDLSSSEVINLLEKQDVLRSFGFGVEDFGGTQVRVTAVPAQIPERIVYDLLKGLAADFGRSPDLPEDVALLISSRACRMSVTAGRNLSPMEMRRLVQDLEDAEAGFSCPHGRPTSVSLTRTDLERLFKRR